MNKENAKDYLPLVQALAEGKDIQCRYKERDGTLGWRSVGAGCDFLLSPDNYRIKPEPEKVWITRRRIDDSVEGVFRSLGDALRYGGSDTRIVIFVEVI